VKKGQDLEVPAVPEAQAEMEVREGTAGMAV
jgi:hypothetical protein